MSTRDVCIFLLLCISCALGAATSTSFKPTSGVLTCPYRTVNYLTHGLPQQCLPSPRISVVSSELTNSTITRPVTTSVSMSVYKSEQSNAPTESNNPFSSLTESSSTASLRASSTPTTSSVTSIQAVTTITAASVPANSPVPLLPGPVDEDSPLESGNFLSFEEWKKQNLIQAGQSEHVGRNARAEQNEPRKRQENVHNTLDALGDDAEIDLDFSGLVPGGLDAVSGHSTSQGVRNVNGQPNSDTGSKLQTQAGKKHAGTTSKERFNYASFDCAANVLKSNAEAKNANLVLRENKDLYMLNKCSASNKFIILELCEDISIDTVVLANFEFFSSSFRTFRVSVSDKYPIKVDKWKTLGTFEARNTREVQPFLVENSVIWASYIRIEFLTHYGTEFYCPVSLIRVHGTTMMEEYKYSEMSVEEDEDEFEATDNAETTEDGFTSDPVDKSLLPEQYDHAETPSSSIEISSRPFGVLEASTTNASEVIDTDWHRNATSPNDACIIYDILQGSLAICHSSEQPMNFTISSQTDTVSTQRAVQHPGTSRVTSSTRHPEELVSHSENRSSSIPVSTRSQPTLNGPVVRKDQYNLSVSGNSADNRRPISTGVEHSRINTTTKDTSRPQAVKHSSSGTSPQPASPTMQESFFKSVQKRLQTLESNSSLSLQYIEEQSRALRDAFRKVEQRQLSKTGNFLEQLNQTVLNELREFRQQYDLLWQSTVIELELQRERHQQESQAMNARLGILADELIFQRRVSILQMVLILVCLALILFSRGALNNYLELPLVQSVLARSPSSKWMGLSGDSRTNSPTVTRTRSERRYSTKGILKSHNRGLSEDSNNELLSASELYSPPTPVSFDGYSDAELVKADTKTEDPEFDPINIQRPSTSPPVLPSIEGPATPQPSRHLHSGSIESRILTPSPDAPRMSIIKIDSSPVERHLTWDLPE